MFNIDHSGFCVYDTDLVQEELNRLCTLIGTDGEREVECDIEIFNNVLNEIDDVIFGMNKDFVIVKDVNMWEECHDSLDRILKDLNLRVDDNRSDFDNYTWCIVKKEEM